MPTIRQFLVDRSDQDGQVRRRQLVDTVVSCSGLHSYVVRIMFILDPLKQASRIDTDWTNEDLDGLTAKPVPTLSASQPSAEHISQLKSLTSFVDFS